MQLTTFLCFIYGLQKVRDFISASQYHTKTGEHPFDKTALRKSSQLSSRSRTLQQRRAWFRISSSAVLLPNSTYARLCDDGGNKGEWDHVLTHHCHHRHSPGLQYLIRQNISFKVFSVFFFFFFSVKFFIIVPVHRLSKGTVFPLSWNKISI